MLKSPKAMVNLSVSFCGSNNLWRLFSPQEMVNFILPCMDRDLICLEMFHGKERLGESTVCRILF